ncbi:CoA ester lyase [Sedimentitalea sp.]|uniref:HpcH/HpaI aldolase/citrate lyase family protein n=1 Tax=Sedimentitalea sp. TaxID=2048915 RepID=UPI0032999A2C
MPLFVPATRPDRLDKAAASGADAVIVDLEDAVTEKDKIPARNSLRDVRLPECAVILRINEVGSVWHDEDLNVASELGVSAIMLPKSEDANAITSIHDVTGIPILALVETAKGIANLGAIAGASGVVRLVFGSVDYAADIGCAHDPEPLLFARMQIVQASRLAALAPPIDGVTLSIADAETIEADARRAIRLGFSSKLSIHPLQVPALWSGLCPSKENVEWAERVIEAEGVGAALVDGAMVDAPVHQSATRILNRYKMYKKQALVPCTIS